MKRILNTLIISAASVLAFSCMEKESFDLPMNESIILDLSSGITKASDNSSKSIEAFVSHLDVFIFEVQPVKYESPLKHYERYEVNNSSQLTLSAKRSEFTQDADHYVYVIANSTLDKTEIGPLTPDAPYYLGDLIDKKQEDLNLHLTGLNASHAPKYFLMDGAATDGTDQLITLNNGVASDVARLQVELKRAAAKVVINITAAENVEFKHFTSQQGSDGGLYYVRNLPIEAYLLSEAKSADFIDAKVVTTGWSDNDYFTWAPETDPKHVSLVTYVYPHHWLDDSLLEKETCVVMNLPLTYTSDGTSTDYHNSWYKIHMTGDEKMFERNMYYYVDITLNRPGALSESQPVTLNPVYYDVEDWTEVEVNVSTENGPQYLQLNTDHVDMYNMNVDEGSLIFASSSPIAQNGIQLLEAYYYNSLSAKTNVSSTYPQAYNGIKAVADAGVLNGGITITSPFVAEGGSQDSHSNAIRYLRFRVTNTTGQSAEFTVAQYPTVYITNELGSYSYRSDFGGTHLGYTGSPNYSGVNWVSGANDSTPDDQVWDYDQKSSVNNYFFGSKMVNGSPNSRGEYDIQCVYRNGNSNVIVDDGTFNNPRMYHVHVTATSSNYIVARPRLDADGYTESSPENTRLVSPSFMIASQLGATNIPSSGGGFGGGFGGGWGGSIKELPGGIRQAKMHCEQYVEVGADGSVYDDWRLPTAAEIDIIINHQYASSAMAEVLSGSRYYCAYNIESGQPEHTKSSEGGNSNSCHVRCIRDAY